MVFGEGVVLPEDCTRMFALSELEEIDLSRVNAEGVKVADRMFGTGNHLQEILAPAGLKADVVLPVAFTDGAGTIYTSLPKNQSQSLTLTRASVSDELADYNFEIVGDRVKLLSYQGEETDITVPGTVTVAGKQFRTVELTPGMWEANGWQIRSLSFGDGVVLPEDCSGLFARLYNITSLDLSGLDWSGVTKMRDMFEWCWDLEMIDLSGMNTANVTDMSGMFRGCENLTALDLTGFDTGKVTDMSYMFSNCNDLTSLDLRLLNTQNVKDMGGMFNNCCSLSSIRTDGWDTKNVANMEEMFYWCENLTALDLSGWDTGNVTTMCEMFYGCEKLTALTISGMDTSKVTDMSYMFGSCTSLPELNLKGFNTSGVTNMRSMFDGCASLTELDLSGFTTSALENMRSMFRYCSALTKLNLESFDASAVVHASKMFTGCRSLATIYAPKGFTKTVSLPAVYEGSDGGLYGTLPRDLTQSIVLLYARDFKPGESGDPEPDSSVEDAAAEILLSATEYTYSGAPCEPEVRVIYDGTELRSGTDYTVSYRDNTNAGEAAVTISGRGRFGGTVIRTFTIHRASLTDAAVTISGADTGFVYSGTEIRPAVTAVAGDRTLEAETDYTVGYADNIHAGTATVTLTGKGNYTGTKEAAFVIAKAPQALTAQNLALTWPESGRITVSGAQGTVSFTSASGSVAAVSSDGTVTAKKPGSARITVSAAGSADFLAAETTITVTVSAASLTDSNVTVDAEGLVYDGTEQEPAVTVTYNGTVLEEEDDYDVTYSDNTDAGEAGVTVTGKGNYRGTVTKTFTIAKAAQKVTAKAAAAAVSVGKTTTVKVTGAQGKVTYKSSDTTLATVTTAGKVTAKKVGTVKITVKSAMTDNYKAITKTVTIKIVPAATKTLKAANQAKGIKLTWAKVAGASGYIIYRNNTKVRAITKGTTVTWTDTAANTNGTKYVYKVFAKASTGTSKLSKSVIAYRVARPAVSSLENSSTKSMTVKWGKNAKATGYVIQYGLKKDFSDAKNVTVAKAATVTKTITKLTKNKTYYVRISTYKTVNKVKYYSAWSVAKTVKITK